MPPADVPSCSRLRGVLIFEQNVALASVPCTFRFQVALEPIFESAFLQCYAIMNSGSEIGLPGRNSIGFYLDKHQNGLVRPVPGRVFDLKCRSCGLACPIRSRPKSGQGNINTLPTHTRTVGQICPAFGFFDGGFGLHTHTHTRTVGHICPACGSFSCLRWVRCGLRIRYSK